MNIESSARQLEDTSERLANECSARDEEGKDCLCQQLALEGLPASTWRLRSFMACFHAIHPTKPNNQPPNWRANFYFNNHKNVQKYLPETPPLFNIFLLTTKNLINFYAISTMSLFPSTIKNAFLPRTAHIFNYELALLAGSANMCECHWAGSMTDSNSKSCLEDAYDDIFSDGMQRGLWRSRRESYPIKG